MVQLIQLIQRFILIKFANAINTYEWDLTFNMDETCIRLNNSIKITLAPAGSNIIAIDKQRNDKETVTTIGTITKNTAHRFNSTK